MVHGIDTAFSDLNLGHKLNAITGIGILVMHFGQFVVNPTSSEPVDSGVPANCGDTGAIFRPGVKEPSICVATQALDTLESCALPASGVTDCTTGYAPGTEAALSTTCPTGCIFTAAATAAETTCTKAFIDHPGQEGLQHTGCTTAGPGACTFDEGTNCDADFKEAAPQPDVYGAIEIHRLEIACHAGCRFTPRFQHEESSNIWRLLAVFCIVTVPGFVSGVSEDMVRIGNFKVLSTIYLLVMMLWIGMCGQNIVWLQELTGWCATQGHDDLTEGQRKHYGEEHHCQALTGTTGSIYMLLVLMTLMTAVMGFAGACMILCGEDGAYGYEDDDEESAKSDSK